ncbi:MAG: tetratricopeptide repeat protein, partial [Marinicellaceae bacterium]
DQSVSKLKKILSSFKNENYFETVYGQGIKFLPKVSLVTEKESKKKRNIMFAAISMVAIIAIVAFLIKYSLSIDKINKQKHIDLANSQHILVMPTNYSQLEISSLQEQGLSDLLQSTFDHSDSEGKMIFGDIQETHEEIMGKFWLVDKELSVLQSNVIKNGEIYEAIINISQGSNVIENTKLSASSLSELLENQINYMAKYQSNKLFNNEDSIQVLSNKDLYVDALGFKKINNLSKAKEIFEKILESDENQYLARFELAKILMTNKDYEKALAQLTTLKSTNAYDKIGAEIELSFAKIYFIKNEMESLIEQLTEYQSTHLNIGEVKKSKIKLQIGKAYRSLGDMQNAMKNFKQAISTINQDYNPDLFSQSYYGQGMVLLNQSNDESILKYFEKALNFARLSKNLEMQIIILDEMAKMLWVSNNPEEGIKLKKQALSIMEIVNDKSEVAKGLGTLAGFLIQRGRFTEAKEVNDRLGDVAKELEVDSLYLNYLHYDAVILMNLFQYDLAKIQIQKQNSLAMETNNHVMQLDNAFLEFELRLAQKQTDNFKEEWDKRTQLIQELGFSRYQVYMDYYLARYYKEVSNVQLATELFNRISEEAQSNNDIKILVDAQNELAEMYIDIDVKKSIEILNGIEVHNPNVNPYLLIKARTYNKFGKKIEALNLLNQAKLTFNQGWKVEDQALLEELQESLN